MDKAIGAEASVKVEVVDGKVILSGVYDGKGADVSLSLSVDGEYLLDKLAEAIPGENAIETVTIAALKMGLKAVKV